MLVAIVPAAIALSLSCQEVDVIFQRVLQEIEKQHGAQDDGGCVIL